MPTLRNWLSQGDFSLSLSSSYFGFFAHCGVVEALREAGFQPNKLSGSSSGAMVAGAISSGLTPEKMTEILFTLKREDFWDPQPGFGILRGVKMRSILERHFVPTFAETKIPLEISVLDIFSVRTRFINSGPLPQAVVASCAVPLLFHPVKIDGRWYIDGGVFNKAGVAPAPEGERNLCIFMEGRGLNGIYERKKMLPPPRLGQKVWSFAGLPAVNYYSLGEGKRAYEEAYQRARASLDLPMHGYLLNSP